MLLFVIKHNIWSKGGCSTDPITHYSSFDIKSWQSWFDFLFGLISNIGIKACMELLSDTLDQHKDSILELNGWTTTNYKFAILNVQTWVSATLTNLSICENGVQRKTTQAMIVLVFMVVMFWIVFVNCKNATIKEEATSYGRRNCWCLFVVATCEDEWRRFATA